ncbi:hypothetical protein DRP04_03380 [Archaeoglobales archaeon]|nr:MAG: hypothetical protein DRP04_03380 [Archaeoglobales archaeon]
MRATSVTLGKILFFALILFIVSVNSAEAATVTAYFNKTYPVANGTSNQIQLDTNLTSVSDATVSFTYPWSIADAFDNSGGGHWFAYDNFFFTAAITEYAQYKIEINGNYINVTNSTGYLKASLIDPQFWNYVNTSSFWDIRLFNQTGDQLYFWIEDFNSTAQTATIWVNVTPGSSELDLAYGNPNALPSAYNNISKTGVVGDDFNDGVLSSQWVVGAGTWSESNGLLTATSTGSYDYIYSPVPLTSYVVYAKILPASGTLDWRGVVWKADSSYFYFYGFFGTGFDYVYMGLRDVVAGTTIDLTGLGWHEHTGLVPSEELDVKVVVDGITYSGEANGVELHSATNTTATGTGVGFVSDGASHSFDWIFVAKLSDPASFGVPKVKQFAAVNATLLLNGNAVTYVGELNATNPSSGKLAVSSTYFVSGLNWVNFTAESGDFSATLEFNYTYDIEQTETTTFNYMWVNLSAFYIPVGTVSSNTTVAFNTSAVGTPIYSYYLKVYVNGVEYSNYKVTDFEIAGVKYINVSVLDVPVGSVTIAIQTIFTPSYINVTVYDELSKAELTSQTLNLTLMDLNYNVLKETTITGNTTISVVYAGNAYLRVRDPTNNVIRQIMIYVPLANNTSASLYFPTSNVAQVIFEVKDVSGSYTFPMTVYIKKFIDREVLVQIHTDKTDVQNRVTTYLIVNEPYEIFLESDGKTINYGFYSPPGADTVTIIIGKITIQPFYQEWLKLDFLTNETDKTITVNYNSTKPVKTAEFWVENETGLLYYANATTDTGSFTFNTTAEGSYTAKFRIECTDGTAYSHSWIVRFGKPKIPFLPEVLPAWLKSVVACGIILVFLMIFGNYRSDISTALAAAMYAIFWYFGWIVSNVFAVVIAAIIAFAAIVTNARKEVRP